MQTSETSSDVLSADDPKRGLIMSRVETALAMVVKWMNDPNRQGGYFCLRDVGPGTLPSDPPVLVERLGVGVPRSEGCNYFNFCQEKACRLAVKIGEANHVSSWQSRDESREMYGGAIRAGDYIFSFSGLPEVADEAAVVLAAMMLGFVSEEEVHRILDQSENTLLMMMLVDQDIRARMMIVKATVSRL